MPTASKSADIIRMEGKSHRTKKELRQREQAEKALLTGIPLKERQEVKDNEIAHKEFLRLKKLLEKINKFDDMYGAVINRYCILYPEVRHNLREKLFRVHLGIRRSSGRWSSDAQHAAEVSPVQDSEENSSLETE